MPQEHDAESRKRQLTRDSMPAKYGTVRRLEERVAALERFIQDHTHALNGKPYVRDATSTNGLAGENTQPPPHQQEKPQQ